MTTTDNIPAQAMVDSILGPKLVTDLKGSDIAKQIKVYAYGRLDSKTLGGDTSYGKLHAKFAIIDGEKILVGTSNLDPRSRYLNTELGVIFEGSRSRETALNLQKYFEELASKSTQWGSDEWSRVRNHKESRISMALQKITIKIIHFFNLVPLI